VVRRDTYALLVAAEVADPASSSPRRRDAGHRGRLLLLPMTLASEQPSARVASRRRTIASAISAAAPRASTPRIPSAIAVR